MSDEWPTESMLPRERRARGGEREPARALPFLGGSSMVRRSAGRASIVEMGRSEGGRDRRRRKGGMTHGRQGDEDRQHLGSEGRGGQRPGPGDGRVEFAAAYASECEPGPIAVGHDGRRSARCFAAAVRGRGRRPPAHDALMLGADGDADHRTGSSANPAWRAESRSRRRTIPRSTMDSSSSSAGGWCSAPIQGRALLDRWQRREFGWARVGRPGPGRAGSRIPIRATSLRLLADRGPRGDPPLRVQGCARRLPRGWRAAGDPAAGGARGRGPWCWARPAGRTVRSSSRTHRGESRRVRRDRAGGQAPRSDSPRIPTPIGWRSWTSTGRYIGEELTLALAARRRLEQARGPRRTQPLDLADHRSAGSSRRLPGLPHARGRDQRRRADDRRGRAAGGRGQRRA